MSTDHTCCLAPEILDKQENASGWARLGLALATCPLVRPLFQLEFGLRTGVWPDWNEAPAIKAVSNIGDTPILFIVGENDEISPVEDAQRLYEAAPSSLKRITVIPGVGHQTYRPATGDAYETAVLEFLEEALPAQPCSP